MSAEKMSDGVPDYDTILDVCSDRQRRVILAKLLEQNRPLTMRDLMHAIAKHNHHAPLEELASEVMERVQISLHHIHLQKLQAAELIEYDTDRQLVEPTEMIDEIHPTLAAILDADPALDSLRRQ